MRRRIMQKRVKLIVSLQVPNVGTSSSIDELIEVVKDRLSVLDKSAEVLLKQTTIEYTTNE